uniref:Peptidase metallopeptidase domain-containing protein n=1 Tax=Gibberella zeae TaxID=5518 RepID=A0A4E9E819_GIBZA
MSIHMCTQMPIEPELQAQADMLSMQENPKNGHQLTAGDAVPGAQSPLALAIPVGSMWRNGRKLRVRILNGSDKIKGKIKQYAEEWNNYSGVKFVFADSGDAEIRVNVNGNGHSWSYVGTENLAIPANKPTMNFGWLTDTTPDMEFSRVIVHEFGHALGCIHEHQSPAGGIPWDKEKAYVYYSSGNNWDRETVDRNIFDYYSFTISRFSDVDKSSIMMYEIPKSITTDGYFTVSNTKLSDTDKAFIAGVYPPSGAATSALKTGPDVSKFNTMEVRPWDKPQEKNFKTVNFSKDFDKPPSMAVGLNWLDVGNNANIRVSAYADNIKQGSATLHIDSWADTTMYSAACVALQVADNDPDFQVGKFSTSDDHPWNKPQQKTSRRINFAREFKGTPKVVVWLSLLDMDKNRNWRVLATASDVSPQGFTMNIDTWADTILYAATAHWIAYPSYKEGVTSGTYKVSDIRPWDQPRLENLGRVDFPANMFKSPPMVLTALNRLDIDKNHNLRVKLGATGISAQGMDWRIEGWFDTVLYDVGASYIALS